jgi:hypothetical protein
LEAILHQQLVEEDQEIIKQVNLVDRHQVAEAAVE